MAAAARVKKPDPKTVSGSNTSRFYLLVGGLVVVGAGALFWLTQSRKDVSIPANVTVLAADTAGFRGYFKGSESAPVEISEYADYQCPACQYFATVQLPSIRRELIETGLVRWRFRDFPLDGAHPHARLAAHSAACANDQGKFWEQHDGIFDTHANWSGASSAGAVFRNVAKEIGLDLGEYDDCMSSTRYAGRIEASLLEGTRVGVSSTPTFLIGGRLYPGAMTSDSMASLVRALTAQPQ